MNAFLDQWNAQESQISRSLPTLTTLFLTVCLPWVCQRSLDVWRATQVYDGQPDKHDAQSAFTVQDGERKPMTPKGALVLALKLWPIWVTVFVVATAHIDNESRWPAIAFVRNAVPYATLFGLFCFSALSWIVFTSGKCHTVVTRSVNAKDKSAKEVVFSFSNSQPAAGRSGLPRFVLLVVLPSALLTYFCYSTEHSWQVLALLSTALLSFNGFILVRATATTFQTASFRAHLKRLGFMVLLLTAYVVVVLVVVAAIIASTEGVKGLHLFSLVGETHDKSRTVYQFDEESQKTSINFDVPTLQLRAIIYALFWATMMPLPASLITFIYRYEQSKAGLTIVTPGEAEDALALSKDAAQARQASNSKAVHPFDNLGRTPILIDCHPVKVDRSKLKMTPKPLCTSAITTMILAHIYALDLLSGLSTDAIVPFFPHTIQDVRQRGEVSLLVASYAPLVAYPIILLITIPSVIVFDSICRGESIAANFRHLWKYEEKWAVSYKRAEPPVKVDAEQEKDTLAAGEKSDELQDIKEVELIVA